jgi:hypothetical protein
VIHGEPGVGKSTVTADMAKELNGFFILGEDGISKLGIEDLMHTPDTIKTWEEFTEYISLVAFEDHPYKCIVIDTLDSIMPKFIQHVVDVYYGGSTEKAQSYGAYNADMKRIFSEVLEGFNIIMGRGIHVVVIVHSVVNTVKQPDVEAYSSYEPNLPGGTRTSLADMLVGFADYVLFCKYDYVVSEGKARGKNRVIMTQNNPAYTAKTRGNVPEKINLSWIELKKHLDIK